MLGKHSEGLSMQAADQQLVAGDLVVAEYKTGMYIGELVEVGAGKSKVRVLAVVKHPEQGNLHAGHRANVSMFHQRRALAYREVANVLNASVRRYCGEVPAYGASLKDALARALSELEGQEDQASWVSQSLESLRELQREYESLYNGA